MIRKSRPKVDLCRHATAVKAMSRIVSPHLVNEKPVRGARKNMNVSTESGGNNPNTSEVQHKRLKTPKPGSNAEWTPIKINVKHAIPQKHPSHKGIGPSTT
jgi:hypothetical protein